MHNSEQLLDDQSEIVKKITSIQVNFKKDGASRKTPENLKLRLERLELNWEQFALNNTRLSLAEEPKDDSYFKDNVFEKVREIYQSTKKMIELYQQQIMPQPTTVEAEHISTTELKVIETLNEHRSNVKALERSIQTLNIDDLKEKWQLDDKLKTITSRWETYDRYYWKLDNVTKNMGEYEIEYNYLENLYENSKIIINKKIWSHIHQERSTPKIVLPAFDGSYTQWPTFKDLFMESVHSNMLIPNAQKMQHLKSKLKGEAERLVQHLNISADNYETCWNILSHRYENTRLQFSHHANALLNQPNIQQATAAQLKKFHDTTYETLKAISNLQIDTNNWDPLLVHILSQKLDSDTRQAYIESLAKPRDLPKIDEFLHFLEHKFVALESNNSKPPTINKNSQNNNNSPAGNKPHYYQQKNNTYNEKNINRPKTYHSTARTCPNCNGDHGLYHCKEFLDMTTEEKLKCVRKINVCENCLFSHNGSQCRSNKTCKNCNECHSTLLHDAMHKTAKQTTNFSPRHSAAHVSNDDRNQILLATALLKVRAVDGSYVTLRALLEQGSQITMITENAVQQLRLKKTRCDAVVTGLGASSPNKCKGEVELTCNAIHSEFTFNIKALVMTVLTNKLPNKTFNNDSWNYIEHLKLADPQFNISSNIDMLLGADIYSELILEGLIRENNSSIIAQQTRLGWVICGKYKTFSCHVVINDITDMTKFWEQEEISNQKHDLSTDDACEEHYINTTIRLPDGKYRVKLPMKPGFQEKLGQSKSQAIAQYKQLRQKFNKNPTFADSYKNFMRDYEKLGHMRRALSTSSLQYFLPHHGVIKEQAVTTKLRTVFNASAKTSTGFSLNDLMETGPNLQADLQTLLLQWRKHKYVFTADIEKMYRNIEIHPDDMSLQKIIWGDSPNKITEYELTTVTYGTTAAPYLAQRTLKQLASDEGNNYPLAGPILVSKFFMDDALFGADTIEAARSTRDELINLLKSGGFNLRKWSSNEPLLVQDLEEHMRNPCNFDFTEAATSKTLGLGWNPKTDQFIFSSTYETNKHNKYITKRSMLSEVAKLFDPLGWLSPITVKTKIIFQKVWLSKIAWDEKLPESIFKDWKIIRDDFHNINTIKIPRWLGFDNQNQHVELHGFCDASEKAYACVIYSKIQLPSNDVKVTLVAAKTKVAPISKRLTLPRLELCGALLLSKLANKIKQCFNTHINIYGWTDSMVVLGWLHGDHNRWNTYVTNRVQQIKTEIEPSHWNHVKSAQNPADCASRGLLPSQLTTSTLFGGKDQNGFIRATIAFQPQHFQQMKR